MNKKLALLLTLFGLFFISPIQASAMEHGQMHTVSTTQSSKSSVLALMTSIAILGGFAILAFKSPKKVTTYLILAGILTTHVIPGYLLSRVDAHADHGDHATSHPCCAPATTDTNIALLELPEQSFNPDVTDESPELFIEPLFSLQSPRSPPFSS